MSFISRSVPRGQQYPRAHFYWDCNQFFFFYLRFPVFQNIYIKILKYNSIDILCFPYLMLFWNCLIFFFNGGCAPFLIPNDVIPIVSFTDFQHFFTDIKSISNDADWKSGKVLLYFCCYPYKSFPFTILLYFFITQLFLRLSCTASKAAIFLS